MVYRNKWGDLPVDKEGQDPTLANAIMDDLYEKHYKNMKIDGWIVDYHNQKAKEVLQKQAEQLNLDEYIKMKQKLKKNKKQQRENSDGERSSKIVEVSQDDSIAELGRKFSNPRVNNIHKIALMKSARKLSVDPDGSNHEGGKPNPGTRTPTKKDIKKKRALFEDVKMKFVPKQRHEESHEDFAEFEELPPMVKQTPYEQPQLLDMNKVLAGRIKQRYRSTDRFIRVQQ